MIMQTPSSESPRHVAGQLLEAPIGNEGFALKDMLEAAAHPMSNDPNKDAAKDALETLTRAKIGVLKEGQADKAVLALQRLALAQQVAAECCAENFDPVKVAAIIIRGVGPDDSAKARELKLHHASSDALAKAAERLSILAPQLSPSGHSLN